MSQRPAYRLCEGCGTPILTGQTDDGQRLTLEVNTATYVVIWENAAPVPRLVQGQGYPVHWCAAALKETL
jgi:hypothetical protein